MGRSRVFNVQFKGDATSLLGTMGKVGLGVGALAVGGAVALGKLGSDFDDAFDTIRVGTGATGEDLEGLKTEFRDVFRSIPVDAESASRAIADLNTRTGLTGDALENLARQELELARVTDGNLDQIIAASTRAFGDWSIATEDQALTLDKVFRASQATGLEAGRLLEQVVQYGAPLRQFGFSFDESIAILGKFEREGVNAEQVLGGLRQGLGRIAKEGEDPIETLTRLTDQIKNAGSAGAANALAVEVFGTRAGPDMAAAIREGRFELEDMLDTIENGEDTIADAAKDTESFGEKWQKLANRVLVAVEPVAVRVFDAIGHGMDALGPIITRIADAFVFFGQLVRPIFETLAGLFTGTGSSASAMADTIGGVVETLTTWFETFRVIFSDLFNAFRARLDTFRESFASIWESVQEILSGAFEIIKEILEAIRAFWEAHGERITTIIVTVWETIAGVIDGALKIIRGIINTVLALIRGDWSEVWDGIKQTLEGIWATIESIVDGAVNVVKETIGLALGVIGDGWDRFWGGLTSGVETAFSAVVGVIRTAINGILSALESGINFALRGLQSAIDAADVIAGPFINFPDNAIKQITLPRLARGGTALTSGLAIVGERGPEVRYLPRGATVAPLPAGFGNMGRLEDVIRAEFENQTRALVRALTSPHFGRTVGDRLIQQTRLRTGVRI